MKKNKHTPPAATSSAGSQASPGLTPPAGSSIWEVVAICVALAVGVWIAGVTDNSAMDRFRSEYPPPPVPVIYLIGEIDGR